MVHVTFLIRATTRTREKGLQMSRTCLQWMEQTLSRRNYGEEEPGKKWKEGIFTIWREEKGKLMTSQRYKLSSSMIFPQSPFPSPSVSARHSLKEWFWRDWGQQPVKGSAQGNRIHLKSFLPPLLSFLRSCLHELHESYQNSFPSGVHFFFTFP